MTTSNVSDFLRAPRVPQACPVNIVHVRATVSRGGAHHSRHAYIVRDNRDGHLVETISGDDSIESQVFHRWPWFGTQQSGWFGLPRQSWALTLDVTPSEYRRLILLEMWTEGAAKLRALADRCEQFSAVRAAVNRIALDGTGENGFDGEPRYATVYHRTVARGGDAASETVRSVLGAMVTAGVIERVDDPDTIMADGKTRLGDVRGMYRATDSTPSYA